jgi:hypothetical protein
VTLGEAIWGMVGIAGGAMGSLLVGLILGWVRRASDTRDKAGELAAAVAGIRVSVDHLGEEVRELRTDTRERWASVVARVDGLPCHEFCSPGSQGAARVHGGGNNAS